MAIDIINNGSFSNYAYWDHVNGIDSTLLKKKNKTCVSIFTDEEQTVTDTVPPGIYQVLDLENTKKKSALDIYVSAMYMLDEGEEPVGDGRLFFDMYIYKIEEYTRFATGEVWKYELPTKYTSYIHQKSFEITNYRANGWDTFVFTVTLEPGVYIMGFTPDVYKSVENEGENDLYKRYISKKLSNLAITGIMVYQEIIDEVQHHNILINPSFESIDAPFDKWFANGVSARDVQNRSQIYPCLEPLGQYCKAITLDKKTSFESIETTGQGYNQVVEVEYNCRAEFRFWHRADINTEDGYCRAKCYVYKLSYYSEDDNYYSIDSVVYSARDSFFLTYDDKWDYEYGHFNITPGTYMISIVPPEQTKTSGSLYIDNVQFNLFTNTQGTSKNNGSFEYPYTTEDGYFYYVSNSGPAFKFYDGTVPEAHSYVFKDGEYYRIKSTSVSGQFYCNGLFAFTDEDCYCQTSYFRCEKYFFEDGRMAVDEQFVYENTICTANYRGCIIKRSYKVFDLSGCYFVNGEAKEGSVIDLLPGERVEISVGFNEQNPPILLDFESSNPEVASIAEIIQNLNYSGDSNSSNNAIIVANSYGKTTITASYQNPDSTRPSIEFTIYVGDPIVYEEEDITLTMMTPVNYVALGTGLQLKCMVSPIKSSGIPIDWISSDRKIAKVNSKGEVTPISLGTCIITAKNFATDKYATCFLSVVEQTVDPVVVNTSVNSLYLNLGDSTRITAELLNEYGDMDYVTQDVVWSTSNDKVATVDEFGFVKAKTKGNIVITCSCANNPSIKKDIPVEVSGVSTKLTRIELNIYELSLIENYSLSREYLTYKLIPSNTTETDVVWTSSNPEAVAVSQNGFIESVGYSNEPVIITCTSTTNPLIYRSCTVHLVSASEYVPTITFSKEIIKTYIGATTIIDYFISYDYRNNHSIKITTPDGALYSTSNTVTKTLEGVKLEAVEAGDYIFTVSCRAYGKDVSESCPVKIYESNQAPEFKNNLEVLYALQDGSYVLRYYVEDDLSDNLSHLIYVDNSPIIDYVDPVLYKYNGQKYYYYFGSGLTVGDYSVYVEVSDDSNIVTDASFSQSNTVKVKIPAVIDKKTSLNEAKVSYDITKNDVLNYLIDMMENRLVSEDEILEYQVRYQIYCVLYDNLVDILEVCIEYINAQIGASQAEVAAIAAGLTSDGTSVAAYSEGDYTNSNYQTITDMDYYQNVCIKELTNRVLQLEALIQELMNNNN